MGAYFTKQENGMVSNVVKAGYALMYGDFNSDILVAWFPDKDDAETMCRVFNNHREEE